MRIEDCIERQIKGLWGTDFSDIGIPVIKTNNLSYEGLIDYSDVCKRNITPEQASGNYLQFGDLLIEKSGGTKTHSVGYVSYFDAENDKYLCNNFILALRPKNDIFSKFLFYQIHYKYESGQFFDCFNKTTGIQNLKVKDYLAKEIVLPSLEEQKHIAAVLDKCTALIAKYKLMLEKYDTLIKSRFIEMFGDPVLNPKQWSVEKLKTLTSKIGSGATPKGGRESYISEGISLVRSMNVYKGYFEYDGLAHITEEQARELDNVTLQENDVLINITGASVARCCILPKAVLPARVNQHVSILRTTDKLNPVYLSNLLITDTEQRVLLGIGGAGGATREAITKTELETLDIPVPPMSLQNDFAAFVQQIDKSKFAVQKSLEKTEILYKSLMQTYFG